jgi:hypothetical protein
VLRARLWTTSSLGARAGHGEHIWAPEVVDLGTDRVYRRRGRLGVAGNAGVRAFRPRGWFMIYDIWRIMTRRDVWCSPRGCGGLSCGGRRKTTTTGGGEDRVSVGRAAAEGLGIPWPRGSVGEIPAEVTRGSRQPETGRRRRNWGGGTAHRRWFLREIPMMQRLGAQLLGSGSLQVAR